MPDETPDKPPQLPLEYRPAQSSQTGGGWRVFKIVLITLLSLFGVAVVGIALLLGACLLMTRK